MIDFKPDTFESCTDINKLVRGEVQTIPTYPEFLPVCSYPVGVIPLDRELGAFVYKTPAGYVCDRRFTT